MLQRRLSSRTKARNPWTMDFRRYVPRELLNVLKGIVKKSRSAFGVSIVENLAVDSINYTDVHRLARDFSRICKITREEVCYHSEKPTKGSRKGNANIVLNFDKPFEMRYWRSRRQQSVKFLFFPYFLPRSYFFLFYKKTFNFFYFLAVGAN